MSSIKHALKRTLNRLGWDFRRVKYANLEETVIRDVLRFTGAPVVLDVGANIGQFGKRLFDTGYRGRLISFEAIPAVHRELQAVARQRHSWIVAPCAAIGSEGGSVQINVSANSFSSSILAINEAHLLAEPKSKFVDKEVVSVERLDKIATTLLSGDEKIYLKVDTQGYEMEVLKGATGLIDRIVALQLELSLTSLYANAPLALEMLAFVDSLGYEVFGMVPGFRNADSGRLLQMDGFFVRRSA